LLGLDCQIQAITAGFGNPARAGWDGYFSGIALKDKTAIQVMDGCPLSVYLTNLILGLTGLVGEIPWLG